MPGDVVKGGRGIAEEFSSVRYRQGETSGFLGG